MKKIIFIAFMFMGLLGFSQDQVIVSNVKEFPDVIKEWRAGCKYYKVDYKATLKQLKAVKFIDTVPKFVGQYIDGVILLNSELKPFKNLTRVLIFNQLGNMFGLKDQDKPIVNIMSNRFEVGLKHEYYSERIRQRTSQRVNYFVLLAEISNDGKKI